MLRSKSKDVDEENLMEPPRFVAGDQFFNYENFGALRDGEPVRLLSKQHFGLAVSVFASNVVFCILRSCVSPTLSNLLMLSATQANAAQHLIEDLPACLSFFVGFMSDCLPIGDYHRKPYMILGWLWASSMLLLMMSLMWLCETSLAANVYILVATSVSFGTMVPYALGEILLVELAQREALQERGSLVARYQYVRILGSTVGKVMTLVLVQNPSIQRIQCLLTLLAFFSLIPPVMIVYCLREERMSRALTWPQAFNNLHRTAQQKVVWNIVVFVIIFTFFLSFSFPSTESAVKMWSKVTDTSSKVTTVLVQNSCYATAIFVWQLFGLNVAWPALFCCCPVLKFVPSLLLAFCTTSDTVRSPTFFWLMSAIMGLSDGLSRIYLPIALTEIVEVGNEGATVGLMLTFQKTLTMFVSTTTPKISSHAGWDVSSTMVQQDSAQVRRTVNVALCVSYIVNLCSLPGLFFLPTQKLDAQQRRMYGGFTRLAPLLLLVVFVVMFLYSLAVNISGAYTSHTTSKWS